jgi:redox-sensitive bicupin YhaK (pirin superfamily)
MIDVRPFDKLGGADHGWLKARHHFSFAEYHDPKKMSWGNLRVWNDDEIAPNSGFPPHPHADMEIITYVRKGAITHKDSLGNEGRTGGQPGWGAKPFPKSDRSGRFITLASGFEDDKDALPIRTDARVLGATLKAGESTQYTAAGKRHLYLVPAAGSVEVNGVLLNERDGAAIKDETALTITALEDSELVLVDAA